MTIRRISRAFKRTNDEFRPTLTLPQWTIYRDGWLAEAQYRVACCGRRFGKSFLAIEEIRRACKLAVRLNIGIENEIWYAAPTFKNAKDNFWRILKRRIPSSWVEKIDNTSGAIFLKSGHVIRIVGLDNHDDRRGAGLWFVVLDECADVKPEAWFETLEPMLGQSNGHAIFIGTPKGFNRFYDLHKRGLDGISGYKSYTYTTLQGGNVKRATIERWRSEKDPKTFRQEHEASFESYEGRVLYSFVRAGTVIPCKSKLTPTSLLHIGIDFNINPMSAVVIIEEGDIAYQVDEIVLPTSNTDELVTEIRNRYARNGSLAHITAYPDPAGAQRRTSAQGRTDIGILQSSGMRVLAMSSHPLVRDRNNIVNARFQASDGSRKLFVDPTCRKSIEAYEKHIFKQGSSEPDKGTGFDHIPDSLGYYCFARHAYKPPKVVPFRTWRRTLLRRAFHGLDCPSEENAA